jgi:pimeloyl-ACP methyl ester carboxylesterase
MILKDKVLFGMFICFIMSSDALCQQIPYGNNPAAGHYLDVGDCKIYYEVYGQGEPMVLLHGGVYGYIDEFEPFIDSLSKRYQVICIATRGHGKSEIGRTPYSYQQRAEDAYKVIKRITKERVYLLGFSDGAVSALKLAALYPDVVKKMVVIGAGDLPKLAPGKKRYEQYSAQKLLKKDSAFFGSRLALMPEPNRWNENLSMLNDMYNKDFVSIETFQKIKCPTLVMAGDRDEYSTTENILKCKRSIADAQLSIIPGCGHVVFFCNFSAVWASIDPFLKSK